MTKIDLDSLSREDLIQLRKDVDRALKDYDARRLQEARAALEAQAREMGFTLAEVTGEARRGRARPIPKYRHPENPALTWSGRGRQPAWIKEALAAGTSLEAFAI
ncbi:H-NS family nucleoid-associated regulatory protein [Rhodovulum steppense]|uniref:DNA-binding protein H-NS n=1 Tax=Rhodovulum steppense TaxID=540251 RepID=A0A4R1YHW6_9RHOB|nr:H-NS histone family protein [Rhodovulum steppense]TCM75899.1 DNA-binding protein H-NS [Rhodovulum steppense]